MAELYIGLMSGTSLDGVDAVLVDFSGDRPSVLAHSAVVFDRLLREEFLALNTSGNNELHRAWLAGNALARVYADAVARVLVKSGVGAGAVRAIGAHGQTVRHRPQEFDGTGYTIQLNQPALLAELTGIDVVADFRSRDVAAGGQGAPLVPPFHQAFFGTLGESIAVLNIGGVANITLIDGLRNSVTSGYDCGPGNTLIDAWCLLHQGLPFDNNGRWARGGEIIESLLQLLLQDAFFKLPPPKSTGRDLFNDAWLENLLVNFQNKSPQDVQCTLTELTVQCAAQSVLQCALPCQKLIVCGGGALNSFLMERLEMALPRVTVSTSTSYGLAPLQVEATAFAWLARKTVENETGNLCCATGSKGSRILGAIYKA